MAEKGEGCGCRPGSTSIEPASEHAPKEELLLLLRSLDGYIPDAEEISIKMPITLSATNQEVHKYPEHCTEVLSQYY